MFRRAKVYQHVRATSLVANGLREAKALRAMASGFLDVALLERDGSEIVEQGGFPASVAARAGALERPLIEASRSWKVTLRVGQHTRFDHRRQSRRGAEVGAVQRCFQPGPAFTE